MFWVSTQQKRRARGAAPLYEPSAAGPQAARSRIASPHRSKPRGITAPNASRPERAARPRGRLALPARVAAATVAAFLPALAAGFVNYDDDRLVVRNPYLRLPWSGRLAWIWSTTYMGHYQPLAWMSLGVDYTLARLEPIVFHADSLAWHAAGALALYAVIAGAA